jgi:hypothetical protein
MPMEKCERNIPKPIFRDETDLNKNILVLHILNHLWEFIVEINLKDKSTMCNFESEM